MVKDVLTVHDKREIVFVRCRRIHTHRPTLIAAQPSATKSAAARSAPRATCFTASTFNERTKANCLADT